MVIRALKGKDQHRLHGLESLKSAIVPMVDTLDVNMELGGGGGVEDDENVSGAVQDGARVVTGVVQDEDGTRGRLRVRAPVELKQALRRHRWNVDDDDIIKAAYAELGSHWVDIEDRVSGRLSFPRDNKQIKDRMRTLNKKKN
jgi:hypothetical protein